MVRISIDWSTIGLLIYSFICMTPQALSIFLYKRFDMIEIANNIATNTISSAYPPLISHNSLNSEDQDL